jgi:hypothetical protein
MGTHKSVSSQRENAPIVTQQNTYLNSEHLFTYLMF